MACRKCGGRTFLDDERTAYGHFQVEACMCGWRGQVVRDYSIDEEEKGVARCKNDGKIAVKDGLCTKCFKEKHGVLPYPKKAADKPVEEPGQSPEAAPPAADEKATGDSLSAEARDTLFLEKLKDNVLDPPAADPQKEPGRKKREPVKYRCFFCGEEHEKVNEVGHIEFDDGDGHKRKVFVCYYCASESLRDLLALHSQKGDLTQVLGALLLDRAYDSRVW